MGKDFRDTSEIKIDEILIEQVLGQEDAVEIMKKAAQQRRHVLLIGEPGTGKSMLGVALAQLLPKSQLTDVLSFANPNDENQPLIREVPAGDGRKLIAEARAKLGNIFGGRNTFMIVLLILAFIIPMLSCNYYHTNYGDTVAAIMSVGGFVAAMIFLGFFIMSANLAKRMGGGQVSLPRVIVDNYNQKQAPFFDATGAHAGALLGDILHDPFQSGGLGTPAHERVVAGMIHKANKGVLFIDEIATLQPQTQQELLTALQEKKHPITGQSERSAGAMVRTESAPCDFILVAAGNLETMQHMHPALRSRIRGYGYEIFMNTTMKDTIENRYKIAQFVAQEVKKDKKIPHFTKSAVDVIVEEARRRASRKGHLTLRLRELGGLVRSAGDVAVEVKAKLVEPKHIELSRKPARGLEEQIADKMIERKKEYEVIVTKGKIVGKVNGLAVIGTASTMTGIMLPIEAEVTDGGKKHEIIATGKLGEIAKEAILNISAIIKKYFGKDITGTKDIYVQFLQTYEGVEGDTASIAVATAIISALHKVPIFQDCAMTGSLSVLGEVLPIGGVSSKIEAAIDIGIKNVIVPKSNMDDIVISKERLSKIKIIPVERIEDVLKVAIDWTGKEKILKMVR